MRASAGADALSWHALGLSMAALAQHGDESKVKAELEALIVKSYVHGAFNELNPEAMKRGFHSDFAIFSAKGDDPGESGGDAGSGDSLLPPKPEGPASF